MADRSQLVESVVPLTIASMRPDIEEAKKAPSEVKAKLVYRDVDELDTGMQKVQPLPFLDEEIERYREQIKDSVPTAETAQDEIPSKVLAKVNHVIKTAHNGKTSLFKASQLLEFTFDAFQYARFASQNRFNLQRSSCKKLSDYDTTYREMIGCRISAEMGTAEAKQEECFRLLEAAIEAARKDVEQQQQRVQEEDACIGEKGLEEVHEQVRDMIKMEKSELGLIQEQCTRDMSTIDMELGELDFHMQTAAADYQQEVRKRQMRLRENQQRQRELEEELRNLREEEQTLIMEEEIGQQLQGEAKDAHAGANQDLGQWKGRIEELKQRTTTSLVVMEQMAECVEWIVVDAKENKAKWKQRLADLELESQLALRDSLMASGCTHMMVIADCKNNAQHIDKYVTDKSRERAQAAMTGFTMQVNKLEEDIRQYNNEKSRFQEKITTHQQAVDRLEKELTEVDKKIRELQTVMQLTVRLDTMDERFKKLQKEVTQAFQTQSASKLQFCSNWQYK